MRDGGSLRFATEFPAGLCDLPILLGADHKNTNRGIRRGNIPVRKRLFVPDLIQPETHVAKAFAGR